MFSVCRLCQCESQYYATGRLLDFEVSFYECQRCAYIQTEHPHWIERAYKESINLTDTGILERNLNNVELVHSALRLIGKRSSDSKILD